MARAPDTGDAFVREVDDAYRRDRMATFWRRYGRWLLVAVGVALVAAAAFLWWREQQAGRADERAQLYGRALAELRANRPERAAPLLAQLRDAPEPGYRALARLTEAAAAARTGGAARAAGLYEAIAADAKVARPFRELATIKAAQLRFDTLPPARIVERLRPLAQPGGAWFGPAAELSAAAYLREGRPTLARPLLDAIARDETAPATLRARAQLLAGGAAPAGAPR